MTWWKKILSTIPLLVAGYEVGKSTEENENKELVQILRRNIQQPVTNESIKNNSMSYVEIFSIVVVVIIGVIYVIKIMCKALKNNSNNAPQQQI